MEILVNGQTKDIIDGMTVAQLLELLNIPEGGTAVARNEAVVRKAVHAETILQPGDRIEIIRAVAGG